MSETLEQKKIQYKKEYEKNKKVLFVGRILTYILTGLLFLLMASWFILGPIMEKHNLFLDDIAIPVALMLFGAIALILVIMNPRLSKTSNTKGDKVELVIAICIIIGGVSLLIYNLIS